MHEMSSDECQRLLPELDRRDKCDAEMESVENLRRACIYICTATRAVCVLPLYEAEIVAEMEVDTTEVLTVKVALVAPAGTINREGTVTAPLSADSRTNVPPAGAGPLSVTIPMGE